jgi:cell surface protein SprA
VYNHLRSLWILSLAGLSLFCLSVTELTAQTADSLVVSADSVLSAPLDSLSFVSRIPKLNISPIANPFRRSTPSFLWLNGKSPAVTVRYDSAGYYVAEERINQTQRALPYYMGLESYTQTKLKQQTYNNWAKLVEEDSRQQRDSGGLLDFSVRIPGGSNSAFSNIFGSDKVSLRITGQANFDIGATVQNTEDPLIPDNQRQQVDPVFNQNLKFNIQGTIGDKLNITTDWDTESDFEYQNRLRIVYEGYEDEIIKSVELGNVAMETGNSLIRGGNALFGIKTRAELGKFSVTSVLSQQRGEGNKQSFKGGAREEELSIKPSDYENDTHFFLDFYFRQQFENAVSNPAINVQVLPLQQVVVWVLNESTQQVDGLRDAVAMVDLGVNRDGFVYRPPNANADIIDNALIDQYRDLQLGVTAATFNVAPEEFVQGKFERLYEGQDYEINLNLGIITMKRRLSNRQAIAVQFQYQAGGQPVLVGDQAAGDNNRLFLKLIRPQNITTTNQAWDLTLRNIYSLNQTGLTQNDIELEINYLPQNIPLVNLPGSSNPMIQDLGLDRVDQQGALRSDNLLDFGTITFNSRTGRIMFPYLEPFGERMRQVVSGGTLSEAEKQEFYDKFVYDELYNEVPNIAIRSSKNNFFRINTKIRGASSGSFPLNAFDVVQGSIVVRSGGVTLTEGVDYEVDYSFGLVTITNSQYLSAGQEISIDYESNQAIGLQQRSFMGVRSEYAFSDDIKLGGTIFRYSEQPNQDKVRIGDEPINNTLIGLDAKAKIDAPWLTRFLDRLPLLQTKEESLISFEGEFAQLQPGVAQTPAVQRQIDRGTLSSDEENGISFLDDFEGAENNIAFTRPGQWFLSSPPAAVPGYLPDSPIFTPDGEGFLPDGNLSSKIERADLRAKFSWYVIDPGVGNATDRLERTIETRLVRVQDVFPQRDVQINDQFLVTLDAYYNPAQRGPYNYNMNLRSLTENTPERMWGGMTTVVSPGLQDLSKNNIEFLEFWVQFIMPDGSEPTPDQIADYAGKMYLDMGIISEDVVPNFKPNSEDGLADRPGQLQVDITAGSNPRSFVPQIPPTPNGEFALENQDIEDVGLDGIPSLTNIELGEEKSERALFADFLAKMRVDYADRPEILQQIENDPSNDDYFFYRQSELNDLPLHFRFHRMFGYHEGNSPVTQQGDKSAITNLPDTEGLVIPSVVETNDSYFQYELDLNPADPNQMQIGAPGSFIIDKVDNNNLSNNWYQIRVPLREFKRKVGEIENFQNISYIRMWLSGYKAPFTMRFATFELVGSQWVKEDVINNNSGSGEFFISTVNIEENASKSPIPYREPRGAIRAINRSQQQQTLQNEQSISLEVTALESQGLRMIKRVLASPQNFLNYSNLRMFVHGEGYENREDVELVVRLGNDLVNNYYEYRQPITPSNPDYSFGQLGASGSDNATIEADAEQVWLYDENSMNIEITAFNQLKQLRNARAAQFPEEFDITQPYENADVLQNAVPGAILKIVGNPNLSNISEIGLGVQNPNTPENGRGQSFIDAQVWLNELRVSGFDNTKGWAANAKASIKFADFANVNANITHETEGFGGITSKINERSLNNVTNLSLTASVNLHKLLPSRSGWNFPVTVTQNIRSSTPRFVPNLGGDIRLEDAKGAINNDEFLSAEEKEVALDELIESSESRAENFSVNFSNISKKFSKSPVAKVLLDNTVLRYSYATTNSRDPNTSFNKGWNFNTGVTYSYTFKNVKLFEPFRFLQDTPILKGLSTLGFGYLPSSINTGIALSRKYNERQQRPRTVDQLLPLQQTHTFNYNTNFSLSYQFMRSVNINYQSNSTFDLSAVSERVKGGQEQDSLSFSPIPTFEVFEGMLTDTLKPRRGTFGETYSLNYRPQLIRFKALNWLSYQATYGGGFTWTNAQRGAAEQGATLNNTFRIDQSPSVDLQKLFEKVPFYKGMKLAATQSEKDRAKRADAIKKIKVRKKDERDKKKKERARLEEYIVKAESDTSISSVFADSMIAEAKMKLENLDLPSENKVEENIPEAEGPLKYYSRKVILALLSPQSIDLSMNYNRNSAQGGYNGGALLFNAFNDTKDGNYSPGLAYRTGFSTDIPVDQLVGRAPDGTNLVLTRAQTEKNGFTVRTKIKPLQTLTIDLDWRADNDRTEQETINLFSDEDLGTQRVANETGTYSSGVWAFGRGYRDLFESQLGRAFDDIGTGSVISDSTGNGDGSIVLNPLSVKNDFVAAYLGQGRRTIGDRGFGAFPLPGWALNWSGIEKYLPFGGGLFTSISLSHKYTGRYRLAWSYFAAGETALPPKILGNYQVLDSQNFYEPTSITIEQNFQPLAQLNVNFKSGIRANVGYNFRKESTMSFANNGVSEKFNRGVKVGGTYTIRRLRIPFFPNLRNSLDLNMQMSYNDDTQQRFLLFDDLNQALAAPPDELIRDVSQFETVVQNPTGQTRFEISTIIGYQLSQSIKANFRYRFELISPKASNTPRRTQADILFNLVMNIRSR